MNPKRWQIYTLHGFNVDDFGAGTTDIMANLFRLRGFDVEEIDREHENLLDARTEARDVVNSLIARMACQKKPIDKVILIGHSHGGNLVHMTVTEMKRYGMHIPRFSVLINPALERTAKFPKETDVLCYYSIDDNVVLAADWLDVLPWNAISKMFGGKGNPWGSAGKYGLNIDKEDTNLKNINLKEMYPGTIDHSDTFYNETLCNMVTNSIVHYITTLSQ